MGHCPLKMLTLNIIYCRLDTRGASKRPLSADPVFRSPARSQPGSAKKAAPPLSAVFAFTWRIRTCCARPRPSCPKSAKINRLKTCLCLILAIAFAIAH
jgi:hypothetical protein